MKDRFIPIKHYFLQDINPVVRFLIISDTVIVGAMGLFGPIFALFIEDFIRGSDASVAGIAAGIYLFTKSILQIPTAYIADKIRGEKDDFWMMFVGSIVIAIIPLLYLIIDTPLELYIVQFALGLISAITFPTYMALFTRHVDVKKTGTEWGIYYTLTDITSAAFAVIGGYLAVVSGFPVLIVTVVILSLGGCLLLLPIRPYLKTKD